MDGHAIFGKPDEKTGRLKHLFSKSKTFPLILPTKE